MEKVWMLPVFVTPALIITAVDAASLTASHGGQAGPTDNRTKDSRSPTVAPLNS